MKYFAGTLAISGMLVLGGCDNSSNSTGGETEDDYPTGANGSDNGLGQPTRDNVNREHETGIYDADESENEYSDDANKVIDERQETQQDGNLERAEGDTLNNQNDKTTSGVQ